MYSWALAVPPRPTLWAQASVCCRGACPGPGAPSPWPVGASCPWDSWSSSRLRMVDGFLHSPGPVTVCRAVGVGCPTLREADVHLEGVHTEPGWARATLSVPTALF